jgi:hypothetical protein
MNRLDTVFRLLSLDGGGIKALYSASVLAGFERAGGPRCSDHVHWISGTSSGGILALGLASGKSAEELVGFFDAFGPRIFPNERGWLGAVQQARHLLRQIALKGRYEPRNLRHAVDELFGERTMAELEIDVSIASVNLSSGEPVVFTRQDHPAVHIADVAMATSATPGYLPPHRIGSDWFADGGLWVNSPTLCGLILAMPILRERDRLEVMSIGTVERPEGYRTAGPPQNLPQWIQRMLHASTYGQAALTHDAVNAVVPHLASQTAYIRIPPPEFSWTRSGPVRMDTTTAQARTELREQGMLMAQKFLETAAVRRYLSLEEHA